MLPLRGCISRRHTRPSRKNRLMIKVRSLYAVNSYDKRYGETWRSHTVPKAHRSTKGICCHCHQRPSKEIHHAVYRDSRGAIADREEPGIHVFPLCKPCHESVAHNSQNWIRARQNPGLNNRNTDEFYNRLRIGFEIVRHTL